GSLEAYKVQATTYAAISNNATVTAQGSVVVNADDRTEIDLVAGVAAVAISNTGGASGGLVVLDKDTRAYVDNGATVTALGLRPAATTNSGALNVSYSLDIGHIPGLLGSLVLGVLGFVFENPVRAALESAFDFDGELEFLDLTPVDAPPEDPDLAF